MTPLAVPGLYAIELAALAAISAVAQHDVATAARIANTAESYEATWLNVATDAARTAETVRP